MANIYSSEGLIMNQSNSNGYTRIYSCAKTTMGPYYRLNVSAGNPNMLIFVRTVFSFTQTNYPSGDFHSGMVRYNSINFDTNGNGDVRLNYGFVSGAHINATFTMSNRQAIFWIFDSTAGSFPGKASIVSHITCNRWDYLSITQL